MISEGVTIISQFFGAGMYITVGNVCGFLIVFFGMVFLVTYAAYRMVRSVVQGIRSGWRRGKKARPMEAE